MAFDSGESTGTWVFVIATWAYPIFPLAMVIGAWIAFAKRKDKLIGGDTFWTVFRAAGLFFPHFVVGEYDLSMIKPGRDNLSMSLLIA